MAGLVLEQAVYRGPRPGQYKLLGLSPGFQEAFQSEALGCATGSASASAGVACPGCVFAQPLGKKHVAVVQVADQPKQYGVSRPGHPASGLPRSGRRPVFSRQSVRAALERNRTAARGSTGPTRRFPRRGHGTRPRILQRDDGPNLLGGSQGRWTAAGSCSSACSGDGFAPRPWALLPTSTRSGCGRRASRSATHSVSIPW